MGRRPQPGAAGWRAARRRPAEHDSAAHLDDAHVVRGSATAAAAAAVVSTPALTATIAAATIATATIATFMPPIALTATSVPRWRHHPMHKHMLSFKQRPMQRWWLWFSPASAAVLALHLRPKRRLLGGWARRVPISRRRSRKHPQRRGERRYVGCRPSIRLYMDRCE